MVKVNPLEHIMYLIKGYVTPQQMQAIEEKSSRSLVKTTLLAFFYLMNTARKFVCLFVWNLR
jgi:hypothetical protein